MFPLILHQTWKSKTLPERVRPYHASWKRHNPSLDIRLYDDADCRRFVQDEFPQYLAVYDGFRFAIQRADFFRYLIVYRFGGLYADIDMECIRSMARFFRGDGALFSIQARISRVRQRELGYSLPFQIANCIFAAEPGHPFLRLVIEEVAALAATHPNPPIGNIEDITGPRMLTRVFYRCPVPDLQVLKQIYWMLPDEYPTWLPLSRNAFARHHYWGSWVPPGPTPLRRRWIERFILPNPFPRDFFHRFDTSATASGDPRTLSFFQIPDRQ